MKRLNQENSGFTLIEIIVVLIIVGVLAAIALPNLFSNVAKSKGGEAMATLGVMKAPLEACCQKNSGNCTTCGTQQLGQQGTYQYWLGTSACATMSSAAGATSGDATGWCIMGTPTPGNTATNVITLRRTAAGITCTGAGTYAGIC